jgi:polyphosphate kinase
MSSPSDTIAPNDPQRFLNREMSWMAFNRRVVEEAANPAQPLLERVRFLAISANNMDEFLTVRVGGLDTQHQAIAGDRLAAKNRLAAIEEEVSNMMNYQRTVLDNLLPELAKASIILLEPSQYTADDKQWIERYFHENIFLALTPLVIDPAHPFPFIPNNGVAIAIQLRDKHRKQLLDVILPLPVQLNRFIRLPAHTDDSSIRFVVLEDIIKQHLDYVFPASEILTTSEFRVIRNSEINIVTKDSEDFVNSFESAVRSRKRGVIMRLSVSNTMSEEMCGFLSEQMEVAPDRIAARKGILRMSDIRQMIVDDRPDLLFTPFEARFPERIREADGDCFEAIRHKDLIVHHPFESFDVVLQFIRQAAADPHVVAIKQTLYRTSKDSPIVKALIEAAQAGKSVTVMVELKARFDEEANLRWARDLERAGAQVVFGFMDLKTHAKMTLVIRREHDVLRSYTHFGTGNYHPETARHYTDLSFFTSDEKLGHDAAIAFNYMTGYAKPVSLHKLTLAPANLRQTLNHLIDQEITNAKAGLPAQIWAKMNALVDLQIIDKLYEASCAGVYIDLIVRGACCLRPGLPGLSERIRVKSIVGRFLEHSRIMAFANGHALPTPHAKVFMTSADWMSRNIDWRVETLIPIENPTVHRQILNQIFLACLMDTRQSWELMPDGHYRRVDNSENDFCAHEYFMTNPSLSGRGRNLDKKVIPPRLNYTSHWKNHAGDTREKAKHG